MASVLAIVSKALFEKMVPKDVALGTVVDTDQYVSANKAFDGLGKGDAIFLVTVRPPSEKLWLVGILESPKQQGTAWKAPGNAAPLTDVTSVVKKLKLASGTGIKANKGALGMSLQTPRVLTAEDVALIRALVPKPAKSAAKVKATKEYAEAVAAGPKKAPNKEAKASKGAKAKPAKGGMPAAGLGTLRLDNYRKPFHGKLADLSKPEQTQLEAVYERASELGGDYKDVFGMDVDQSEGISELEMIDVVEIATGKVVANLIMYPYGDGAVVHAGTTKMIADICQHGVTAHTDTTKSWMADFAAAWKEGAKRLKVDDPGHFGFDDTQRGEPDDDDE